MLAIANAFRAGLRKSLGAPTTNGDAVAPTSLPEVSIDVYFHVIHDGPRGRLSDDEVRTQMDVLNGAFAGESQTDCDGAATNADESASSGVAFVLRGITRTDNAGWFSCQNVARDPLRFFLNGNAEHEARMKRSLRRGDCSVLNVYSLDPSNLLGWATFPDVCSSSLENDGVVVDHRTLPGGVGRENFDEGDTLVHEVGHWLGLLHTFENGCAAPGDRTSDTPAERTAARGCPVGRDTCPDDEGDDPVRNFMDYTDDCCMHRFTEGQVLRMRSMLDRYRRPGMGGKMKTTTTETSDVADVLVDAVRGTVNGAAGTVGDVLETVDDIAGGVVRTIGDVKNVIDDVPGKVLKTIGDGANKVTNFFGTFLGRRRRRGSRRK